MYVVVYYILILIITNEEPDLMYIRCLMNHLFIYSLFKWQV